MDYLGRLEILLNEYIKNIDSSNVLNITIVIPDFKGSFYIFTDKFLLGRIEPSEETELCLLFAFKAQSKKGKHLLTRVNEAECMSDFKLLKHKDQVELIKKTGNNVKAIVNTVDNMVENLFPELRTNLIEVDLCRITEWLTLSEKKTNR